MRAAPLHHLSIRLGIDKGEVEDFASLKLLATICQLATIAKNGGFNVVSDAPSVSKKWDANLKINEFEPLFALNKLRTVDSHVRTSSTATKTKEALTVFGIDETKCATGWGQALDTIYDRMTESLNDIGDLIVSASTKD